MFHIILLNTKFKYTAELQDIFNQQESSKSGYGWWQNKTGLNGNLSILEAFFCWILSNMQLEHTFQWNASAWFCFNSAFKDTICQRHTSITPHLK